MRGIEANLPPLTAWKAIVFYTPHLTLGGILVGWSISDGIEESERQWGIAANLPLLTARNSTHPGTHRN